MTAKKRAKAELSPVEQPAASAATELARPRVRKAVLADGVLTLEAEKGQQPLLDAAYGSDCNEFQAYVHGAILNILSGKTAGDITTVMNSSFAIMSAIAPQNELEAMLAAQMVSTHHLAMKELDKLGRSTELHLHEAHGTMANRLLRTFAMQLEALSKHRRGGKQIVEHVHVGSGGQAVIAGTVNTGGTGNI